ncbi:GNAT family N-acetyltransferase, partial [Acinetobacter baumannii]
VRGRGVGSTVLTALEDWAKEAGYQEAWLETHVDLHPAIALYTRAGFQVIPNYSQYCGIETSVCMGKPLIS